MGWPEPLKLHIGCGAQRLDGWLNCDVHAGPVAEMLFDAQEPWPFPDNSVDAVYASHVLEHLVHPLGFFRAAWNALKPVSGMQLRLPYGGHSLAWVDLTHIRPWYAETFCVLQPGFEDYTGNPQHANWQWPFAVSCDLRVSGKFARGMHWWPIRRFLLTWSDHIPNFIEELWVKLTPLKSREAVNAYRQLHQANAMTRQYVMYQHQWERRPRLEAGEAPVIVAFGEDQTFSGFFETRR